jgi:hypothetical protein
MVFFWIASASIAVKLERLRSAEQALLDLATRSTSTLAQSATATSPCIRTFDTPIPVSVVPSYSTVESPQQHASSSSSSRNTACEETSSLQEHQRTTGKVNDTHNEDCYVIHGIEVTSKAYNEKSDTPLVLLHGYSKC